MKLFFELGAPFWSPRAPEVLKYRILCLIFVYGRRSFKFSGFTIYYPNKLLVNLIFCSGSHFGPPGPSKCQNFEFLFMVVEASNFQDLLLFALENH